MNDNEFAAFVAAYDGVSRMLRGEKITAEGYEIAFSVLREYSLGQFKHALTVHVKKSKWVPAPAELIEIIDPPARELTNAELLGLARAADSPLGVWVRYRITQHSLQTWPERQLLTHLETLRAEIDQFIAEGLRGEFSDDAKRVLGSYEFSNRTELAPGLPVQRTMPRLEVVQ